MCILYRKLWSLDCSPFSPTFPLCLSARGVRGWNEWFRVAGTALGTDRGPSEPCGVCAFTLVLFIPFKSRPSGGRLVPDSLGPPRDGGSREGCFSVVRGAGEGMPAKVPVLTTAIAARRASTCWGSIPQFPGETIGKKAQRRGRLS